MKIFEIKSVGFKPSTEHQTFHEQWVSGTYIVTGVFPIHCNALSVKTIIENIPKQFKQIKSNKKALWPKGICGYYSIPIYISENFTEDVISWVHSRPKYKWAMWHEPVLYNTKNNEAEMFRDWGLYCLAFRVYLSEVILTTLMELSRKMNFPKFPVLNGKEIVSV